MNPPLALLLYEKLLPGTQLANRLQDLGWRVQTVHDNSAILAAAEQYKPLLVVADLISTRRNVRDGISALRKNPATEHIPVIAFTAEPEQTVHDAAIAAGA